MGATSGERHAALEIISGAFKLVLARIPLMSLRYRRSLYKSYVNNLSKVAFDIYGSHIISTLTLTKKESKTFNNTEKEVGSILQWLPRLIQYRGYLREYIKERRKRLGVKI